MLNAALSILASDDSGQRAVLTPLDVLDMMLKMNSIENGLCSPVDNFLVPAAQDVEVTLRDEIAEMLGRRQSSACSDPEFNLPVISTHLVLWC
jgi:hypothetical protein